MKVAWYVPEANPRVASLRYRCFIPAVHLRDLSFEPLLVTRTNLAAVRTADRLIIVKYFNPWSLAAAHLAQDAGISVLLDQCENIWDAESRGEAGAVSRKYFDALTDIAEAVVTPSPHLAEAARGALTRDRPVSVIPDPVETPADWAAVTALIGRWARQAQTGPHHRRLASAAKRGIMEAGGSTAATVRRLRASGTHLSSSLPGKRVIWFGNHGSDDASGMLALLRIAPALERVCRDIPLHLLVVSNSRDKYLRYIAPLPVPTAYVEWDPVDIHALIGSADLCVLPNPVDERSLGKSSNRATLALSRGAPVVATMTPALEPLKDCILADDWERGIRAYLSDPSLVERHLTHARGILDSLYSGPAVAARWAEILRAASPRKATPGGSTMAVPAPVRLAVAITLPQDLDVLLPVLSVARRRPELRVTVAVVHTLLTQSPRIYRALLADSQAPLVLSESEIRAGALWSGGRYDALLTAAESSLKAHRLGHVLARQALAQGLRAYTVQHGYENVGLTYFDERHGTDVSFASSIIFTWQDLKQLRTGTPAATLARCIAVGCPKPAETDAAALPLAPAPGRMVAVFENLHWHRYGRGFRNTFLADLRDAARAHPGWRFLVKPHHAGRWLRAWRTAPSNILVIDPADPAWEPFTAPALLAHADAVVSTPSTVVLDAARAGKPVAVAGYDLDLLLYEPLPILRAGEDWARFLDSAAPDEFLALGRRFVERAVLPGDAAARILDRIVADLRGGERDVGEELRRAQ